MIPTDFGKVSKAVTVILGGLIIFFSLLEERYPLEYRVAGFSLSMAIYLWYTGVRYANPIGQPMQPVQQQSLPYHQPQAAQRPVQRQTYVAPIAKPMQPQQRTAAPQSVPGGQLGAEALFINSSFRNRVAEDSRGLYYKVVSQSDSPDYTIYNMTYKPGVTFDELRRYCTQLANEIFVFRGGDGDPVQITLSEQPLFLRISKPVRGILPWGSRAQGQQKHVAQLGVEFNGIKPKLVSYNMLANASWLIGVFASSGSGKSNLIRCMALSLMENMTPQEAEFFFIDLDSNQFDKWESLPHVRFVAKNHEEALGLLQWMVADVENDRNMESGARRYLVADELQILTVRSPYADEFQRLLGRMAEQSRKHGYSIILGTQDPTGDNFPASLQHNVPCIAAGFTKDGSYLKKFFGLDGANTLQGEGDMITASKGPQRSFKSFYLSADDEAATVQAIATKYGTDPSTMRFTVQEADEWDDGEEAIAVQIPQAEASQAEADAALIAEHLQAARLPSGRLKSGWGAALIEILYGEARPNHGVYAARLKAAIEVCDKWAN